jgi:hypothetical protein
VKKSLPSTHSGVRLSQPQVSGEIERAEKNGKKPDAVPRTAFQNDYFSDIDGLIWSRRSIGYFLGNADDLVLVPNQLAKRPVPGRWLNWLNSISRSTATRSSAARSAPHRIASLFSNFSGGPVLGGRRR